MKNWFDDLGDFTVDFQLFDLVREYFACKWEWRVQYFFSTNHKNTLGVKVEGRISLHGRTLFVQQEK